MQRVTLVHQRELSYQYLFDSVLLTQYNATRSVVA